MPPNPPRPASRALGLTGLSGRLLLLTVLFVAVAELLIVTPSLAQFHQRWLVERVRDAELAGLAVQAAPGQAVSQELAGELLEGAGVVSLALGREGARVPLLTAPELVEQPRLVDLRRSGPFERLLAPAATLSRGDGAFMRVVARPRSLDGEWVEIVVSEGPAQGRAARLPAGEPRHHRLHQRGHGRAGVPVDQPLPGAPHAADHRSIERFRENPDDPEARVNLSGRRDEVGRAEAALNRMQTDLRESLHARARLAALGEAVAKINHDLRNMLTSAQMASERLAASGDPQVAQALPRLERALDRAVTLATSVLSYGRSEEPPGRPVPVGWAPPWRPRPRTPV
jgi:signal transduction histidine kinase